MVKQLNITYENKDHEFLERIKEDHGGNWHDFILDLARKYKEGGKKEDERNRTELSE